MGDGLIVADISDTRDRETPMAQRSADVPRLPDDAIVLHIGMHKTGTTAVQSMFVAARAVNAALKNRIERADYHRLVRYGMVRRMVEVRPRGADEAPLALPVPVVELAVHEGKLSAEEIEQTGARLIGDLRNLVETIRPDTRTVQGNRELPLEAAVQAVLGAISVAVYGRWDLPAKPAGPETPAAPRVDELTAKALVGVLVHRVVAGLRRRVVRFFRRVRTGRS